MSFHVPESMRVKQGDFGTTSEAGNNGLFFIPASATHKTAALKVIVSNGLGWEHASVSLRGGSLRCPTWEEMCRVKNLFWDEDDAVMQLHPPKSDYVNNHRACLHLWRPNDGREIPLPDALLVGIKGLRLC